jgi:uncharacterized protein (TIGR02001 family)
MKNAKELYRMNIKHVTTALIALLTLAAGLLPAAPAAALEVEGGVYAGVYDKYLWRGVNLSASQPVLQTGVDVSAKGFTLSYWSNIDLSGVNSDEATETDFVVDYSFDVNDLLAASVGEIFYTFGPGGGSTHELYLGLGLNLPLSPSLTIYYDWDAASTADLDGLFYTLAIGHDLELADKLGLSLGAALNYSQESPFVADLDGGAVFDDFSTADLSVGLSYAATEQVSIDLSYQYSLVVGDDAEDIGLLDDEGLAGVNISLAF